jgi:hypothetical protein
MTRIIIAALVVLVFSGPAWGEQKDCFFTGDLSTKNMKDFDGVLSHCERGDIITFTIQAYKNSVTSKENATSIAAHLCDFGKQIILNELPDLSTQVACVFWGVREFSLKHK